MEKFLHHSVKPLFVVLASMFISGCISDDKEYVSIPVLAECEGFANTLVDKVNSRSGFSVSLRKFYTKPMSHNELYGYVEILASPSDVYKKLRAEINTFEAYCYADTQIRPFSSNLAGGIEKELDRLAQSSYRNEDIYIKVNDGQLSIFVNKLDAD